MRGAVVVVVVATEAAAGTQAAAATTTEIHVRQKAVAETPGAVAAAMAHV